MGKYIINIWKIILVEAIAIEVNLVIDRSILSNRQKNSRANINTIWHLPNKKNIHRLTDPSIKIKIKKIKLSRWVQEKEERSSEKVQKKPT